MNKSGFTLLEIVITMMLSAMMGTILYNAFNQSNRSLRRIEEFSALNATGAVVLHQLEHDLISAIMPFAQEKKDQQAPAPQPQKGQPQPKQQTKKEIEKIFYATIKNNNVDTLTFLTLNPLSAYDTPKPRLVRVLYKLKESADDTNFYTLTRQESNNFDVSLFEKPGEKKPRALVVANTIKKLSLEYVYTVTNEKDVKDSIKKAVVWDSDKKEQDGAAYRPPLPALVKIQLQYTDPVHAVERTMTYEIPVYAYEYARRRDEFLAKRPATAPQPPAQQAQKSPMADMMSVGIKGARSYVDRYMKK